MIATLPPSRGPLSAAPVAAALAAAFCWALASLLWRRLPTSLSAARLNLLKNLLAVALLLPLSLVLPWQVAPRSLLLLALSGVLGIALGDTLFFAALRRLGTRRTLTIDAGGPAVTSLAGVALLGEVPQPAQWLGIALISLAVLLVVHQRAPQENQPAGAEAAGVALALGALACGSGGALLARAGLLAGGPEPLQAATLRLAAAALVMLPLLVGLPRAAHGPRPVGRRWPLALAATLLGTSAGIALQQTALAGLPGGLAVALLSTAPVMALPLAALEGDRPGWRGVLAAAAALAGVSLVAGLVGLPGA
ncbi:EamA family transporter [Cyanobium sp. AMD-g]|uniref:EamA family transporter n=1 Tax=Cyanobium sp. AMD-g TaxID=2823699 RepID=UPI0020CFCF3C|nr:EamA family transporter [Cyanobium sp. AMD-g]MCP9932066.1 EamA family transporter [Cyanobium sp. AMD-g]